MAVKSVETLVAELVQAARAEAEADLFKRLGINPNGLAGIAKGQKRDPEAIDELTRRLDNYIRRHPGERIEQIALGMRVLTKELNLPMKRLLSKRMVKAKGQKRATTYTGTK